MTVHQLSSPRLSLSNLSALLLWSKLGHMCHSAQCGAPETGQHWSLLNLREFASSPAAAWQACWSPTNAAKSCTASMCFCLMCFLAAAVEGVLRASGRAEDVASATLRFQTASLVSCQTFIHLIIYFWPFLTSCHDCVRHLSAVTSRVPEEALRMAISAKGLRFPGVAS